MAKEPATPVQTALKVRGKSQAWLARSMNIDAGHFSRQLNPARRDSSLALDQVATLLERINAIKAGQPLTREERSAIERQCGYGRDAADGQLALEAAAEPTQPTEETALQDEHSKRLASGSSVAMATAYEGNALTPVRVTRYRRPAVIGAVLAGVAVAASVVIALFARDPVQASCDTTAVAAQGHSVEGFSRSLSPGQTLCLSGVFESDSHRLLAAGTQTQPVTITSAPGQRATIRGRLWIADGAHDLILDNLVLDGRNTQALASPTINGDRITLRRSDISTAHHQTCITVTDSAEWGTAEDTVIEQNRIHGCGQDRGRGVEVMGTRTTIVDNIIYDNADAGIALLGRGGTVARNVMNANGIGLLILGAKDHVVRDYHAYDNVITNSIQRAGSFGVNVGAQYQQGAPQGENNIIEHSCVYGGQVADIDIRAGGLIAQENLTTDPQFENPAAGDFRIRSKSPCRGKGPRRPV